MTQLRSKSAIYGVGSKPRVSVFRSNSDLYAQAIDDEVGKTLIACSTKKEKGNKTEAAKAAGLSLAKALSAKKIDQIVFDRGKNRYHGRVKSFADGIREGGIKF